MEILGSKAIDFCVGSGAPAEARNPGEHGGCLKGRGGI